MSDPGRRPTMTVAQLREALAAYPDDLEVWATWESVLRPFVQKEFSVDQMVDGPALVIDVEFW